MALFKVYYQELTNLEKTGSNLFDYIDNVLKYSFTPTVTEI
jgi:hypothetical protein